MKAEWSRPKRANDTAPFWVWAPEKQSFFQCKFQSESNLQFSRQKTPVPAPMQAERHIL